MGDALRGILIDPYTQLVTEVDTEPYPAWLKLLQVEAITSVRFGINEDTGQFEDLWVDDDGLITATEDTRYFKVANYDQPLAGRGIIFGTNPAGETVSSGLPLEFVRHVVSWPNVRFTGFTHDEPSEEHHEVFGDVTVHRQHAHFEEKEDDPHEGT